ncbi:hypothetical protein SAMN05444955_10716 [Lihuaxuella thermophila]|uniref:Uncharacterized protein n=1 Tax=Lihuaxuella thermophila TaxID=1173111 RepID=A0A1H8EKJ5_9BACL|nr:hypothetical protein SAMN05444955_10716 [Lihuaxuella thermophila]
MKKLNMALKATFIYKTAVIYKIAIFSLSKEQIVNFVINLSKPHTDLFSVIIFVKHSFPSKRQISTSLIRVACSFISPFCSVHCISPFLGDRYKDCDFCLTDSLPVAQ